MKKIFTMFLVASIFGLVSCGESNEAVVEEETTTPTEEVGTVEAVGEAVEADEADSEELADHACNDNCTTDDHSFTHGEKGHTCDDDCQSGEDQADDEATEAG